MAEQGKIYDMDDRKYYLFEGLPAEYEQAVNSLRLPGSNYTWEEIGDYLREYCERHKNVPGGARAAGKGNSRVHFSGDSGGSTELCRRFANTGKCPRGGNCKYRHVSKPDKGGADRGSDGKGKGACHACGKQGHLIRDCQVPCTFCGIKGHGEKFCRKRKKAIAELKNADGKTDGAFHSQDSSARGDSSGKQRAEGVSGVSSGKQQGSWEEEGVNFCFTHKVDEISDKVLKLAPDLPPGCTVIDGAATCAVACDTTEC